MSKIRNILIVDDHAEIRVALHSYLAGNGFAVTSVANAAAMDQVLARKSFDLLILDVRLPDGDGLSICKRIRATSDTPILMLSALGEEADIILGLELGADDYISKPFNPREVLARIRAILRRAEKHSETYNSTDINVRRLQFAHWQLDLRKRVLIDQNATEVELTTAEYQLLMAFLERPRAVMSRDRLLDMTSGRSAGPFDRAIDNQVMRLRRKIELNPDRPSLITTIRGGGYAFSADVHEITLR